MKKDESNKNPKLISAILRWPTPLLWLTTLWYLMIFEFRPVALVLIIVAASLMVASLILKGRNEGFTKTAKSIFGAVALVGLFPFFHPSFLTNPYLTSTLAALAAIISFTKFSDALRGYLACIFSLVLILPHLPRLTLQPAFLSAFFILLFLVIAKERHHWMPKGLSLFLLLTTLSLGVNLYIVYKSPPEADAFEKIVSQPGITTLFQSGEKTPLSKALGYECRFIEQGCDGSLLFGTRDQEHGLYIYRDGKLLPTEVKNVSDYVTVDCKHNRIWAGEFGSGKIYGLDGETGVVTKRLSRINLPGVSRLRYLPDKEVLYASRDDNPKIIRYNLQNGQELRSEHKFPHFVTDFYPAYLIEALFIHRWGGMIYRYDLYSTELQGKTRLWDFVLQFDFNEKELTGYVTRFYAGEVLKLNLSTLEVLDRKKLEPGLRFPLYHEERRLLFVSNFFTGYCDMLDADTLALVDRRYFGPRLRATSLSQDGKTLFAASASGGFAWELASPQE